METPIKQTAGIDCGAEELVVSFGSLSATGHFTCRLTKAFANTTKGFQQLQKWVGEVSLKETTVLYVMEATGVYHEKLAYYLIAHDRRVSIVLPNKVNAFAKTGTSKKLDDSQASKVLAEFGCVKQLDDWQPPHPLFVNLKQLSREKRQLHQELTLIKNQLHADQTKAITSLPGIKRMKARAKLIEKRVAEVEKEIMDVISQDEQVKEKIDNVCTIPGVGLQTAVTVVAETAGFYLIRNSRQLVSYAGLDVVQKQSGISVRGRSRISKRSNPQSGNGKTHCNNRRFKDIINYRQLISYASLGPGEFYSVSIKGRSKIYKRASKHFACICVSSAPSKATTPAKLFMKD